MFLLNLGQLWNDYKYWIIVAAILFVILMVIIIASTVSYIKGKKEASAIANVEAEAKANSINEEENVELDSKKELVEQDTNSDELEVLNEEASNENDVLSEEKEPPLAKEVHDENIEVEVTNEQLEENQQQEDETLEKNDSIGVEEEVEAEVNEETLLTEDSNQESIDEQETYSTESDKSETESSEETQDNSQVKARGKYEIIPDRDGFKYVLKASNGQPIIDSETYKSVDGCKKAIKRLQENAKSSEIRIGQDKKGNFQFHVVRGTRLVAHSASYGSKVSAQKAANSFLKFVYSEKMEVIEDVPAIQPELIDLSNEEINSEILGKIIIFQEDELYLFKLVANNGQTICVSTTYKTLSALKNRIQKFQDAVYNGKFYITQDKYHNYQFKLYGAEGNRLILTGETFQTKESCASNIRSCYRFAKNAVIEDLTIINK